MSNLLHQVNMFLHCLRDSFEGQLLIKNYLANLRGKYLSKATWPAALTRCLCSWALPPWGAPRCCTTCPPPPAIIMLMMIMMKCWVDYLRSEVIQVSGQRRPLQVGIRLPHIRVVRVVRWVVVVLAREVQVACKRYLRDPSSLAKI